MNSLECIAPLVSIWIDFINSDIESESCILSKTDSTSTAGWLKKSNFSKDENEAVQFTTSHKLASIKLDAESCLFSQWFPGEENGVSDACSRDFHLNDDELTHLILTFLPNQVPFGFKIFPLPIEISSWLICMLQNQPQKEQWNQVQTPSKLSLGIDFNNTLNQLPSLMTHSSTISLNINASGSSVPLNKHLEKDDSTIKELVASKLNHAEPPLIAWHRPSAWQIDPTQDDILDKCMKCSTLPK